MARPAAAKPESLSERLKQLVAAEEAAVQYENLRQSERVATYIFARLGVEADTEIDCVIRDMSDGGARIRLEQVRPLPATVRLTIPETGQTRICRLAWQKARHAGLAFWDAKRKSYDSASASDFDEYDDD